MRLVKKPDDTLLIKGTVAADEGPVQEGCMQMRQARPGGNSFSGPTVVVFSVLHSWHP